jgi:hypothetical protein
MVRFARLFCVLVLTFSAFNTPGQARVYSEYQAQQVLRELGFRSFITRAEVILVTPGQITGHGGLCIDLPIYSFVTSNNIYVLDGCASSARLGDGTLVFKARGLHISGACGNVRGRQILIIGRDLVHIVNGILP